jgi:hypothetical protein
MDRRTPVLGLDLLAKARATAETEEVTDADLKALGA